MTIESNIFKRFVPDYNRLIDYGFIHKKGSYCFEKDILNEFKVVIEITNYGDITGKVYDLENNDEYLPLRVGGQMGAFAGTVRAAYEKVLIDIRNNCFNKNDFIYPQANRIADSIKKLFKNEPEFLWEKSPHFGVFRNPDSKKWYGIIMNIGRNKLDKNAEGEVEIINIKLDKAKIIALLGEKSFYPAYHMNKKSWITLLLDESLDDDYIMELVCESQRLSDVKDKKSSASARKTAQNKL